ncbi:LysR family transcriptional regulator [Agrobacterium vitis]|uniref:LysR family transcriptional regulator n=1 Tax=Agrobacterium vitis TaxID=373 RepID=A0A368NJX3_AGRVI|nr:MULTISPECIES: LysR family transcriptional regulator [Agrobacterium]MCF1501853.1 LysR family transcriptional regulator [Allorhizobium sp. Av2]KAA3505414.1 LysR family transcriptional regulator [Agrobacterium vitis]KAA3519274.1 LysR family transcriptional regulator [Agrobacterium vitis]MCF1480397.1 LysR family transcriptional regulator [Agrobacterium vitis]MCM2436272.1 LysR family transcriptional regulator [Agrobacterium rosae]
MTTPKIDLSHLAAFITACDSISMSRAADAIGLTTSAFSARLHGLETRLGLKLFARHGRNMWPLPSAVWLYNRSVRLLLAEEFLRLRLRVRSGAEETIRSVIIQLDEAYTGTYMALAVQDAIRRVHSIQQDCFLDLISSRHSPFESRADQQPMIANSSSILELSVRCTKGNNRPDEPSVMPIGTWMAVGEGAFDPQMNKDALRDMIVPELPGTLSDDIARHPNWPRLSHKVGTAAVGLQDYFGMALLFSSHDLLLPRPLMPARIADIAPRMYAVPDGPPCVIHARESGLDPVMQTFLAELRRSLSTDGSSGGRFQPFSPAATLKQIATFNLVVKTGSMAAAARAVGLTAPMVPTQIALLETALETSLIVKGRGGSTPTESAMRLHPICLGIEQCFNDALAKSGKVAAEFRQSIRIGLPPSWSSDSRTSECMAEALSAFHREFPDCRIEVVEGPRDTLHGGVRSGQLNIAVVGRVDLQVGSLPVGASEDISLIVNKNVGFCPQSKRVSADELRGIPLILAPAQVTMHQTLITALAKATVQLEPVMRLGSIPLIVSVIRRSPFGTILPASVVRKELEDDLVEAFPLDHIVPRRRLWAIFSTDNPLSEIERRLVGHIKDAFAGTF